MSQYGQYVFIGDDELTITIVSIIMSRLKEYPPVLAKMYNITHYPDFRVTSPRSLSGVWWVMFSGDYLSKVLRDEKLREAFAQFLREVHLARGGRGVYVAFGNNSHLLFDAFCLAGIYFDEVTCALYRNPIPNNTLIAGIVFADYSRVTEIYSISMPLDKAWTPEDIVDHIVPIWPPQTQSPTPSS
jgi:hypothetical protein